MGSQVGRATLRDDLGAPVPLRHPARRVVSLVPSLTEAIASVDPDLLVGITDWCEFPADLGAARVRGTKNPDLRRIIALAPDLVVANMEENREIDVRRLRDAGVCVWVTRIESVAESLTSMARLLHDGLERDEPEWLGSARDIWEAPIVDLGIRVAVPVWRDPWFVVGPGTFANDLLARCGFHNAFAVAGARYPKVTVDAIVSSDVDLVLLPDEPYRFDATNGPDALPVRTALIPGRSLTWYGPTLLSAREGIVGPALAAF
ncbi:MAG: helical backbone metal receptor [Actinomycetota bacterium]|nr:helical backbone metal receptor [Actinomycetota bacterium]